MKQLYLSLYLLAFLEENINTYIDIYTSTFTHTQFIYIYSEAYSVKRKMKQCRHFDTPHILIRVPHLIISACLSR